MKWFWFSYIALPVEHMNSISLHQDYCNAWREQGAPKQCSWKQELLVPVSPTGLEAVQSRFPGSRGEGMPSFTLIFLLHVSLFIP